MQLIRFLGFIVCSLPFFLNPYLYEFALREGVAEVAPSHFGDFFVGVAGRLAPRRFGATT
jgi:hypothetical protein